jgi:hypothetical protein
MASQAAEKVGFEVVQPRTQKDLPILQRFLDEKHSGRIFHHPQAIALIDPSLG